MSKLIVPLSLLLISPTSLAQMASASIFSEMKSVNPAVINSRPSGQYSLSGSRDTIEKIQVYNTGVFSGPTEIISKTTTEIGVDSYSFFRGGKGGGAFTTEIQAMNSTGSKKLINSVTDQDDTSTSDEVKFQNLDFSVGIGKYLGLGFARQNLEYESNFTFSFGGNTFSEDKKEDITSNIFKAGAVLPFKVWRIAANIEYAKVASDIEEFTAMNGLNYSTEESSTQTLGMAFGFTTKKTHFEVGYEHVLSSDKTDSSPSRISGTAEIKIWKLSLGYTGRMYREGFQENDRLVYNELVYGDENTEDRVEHIINFAFGSDKGLVLAGSGSISKSTIKEKNPFDGDQAPPIDTDVEQLSLALKVGYVW